MSKGVGERSQCSLFRGALKGGPRCSKARKVSSIGNRYETGERPLYSNTNINYKQGRAIKPETAQRETNQVKITGRLGLQLLSKLTSHCVFHSLIPFYSLTLFFFQLLEMLRFYPPSGSVYLLFPLLETFFLPTVRKIITSSLLQITVKMSPLVDEVLFDDPT